jgi:Ni2+-binding GTPase involved in maturation of urease and hydrogenase
VDVVFIESGGDNLVAAFSPDWRMHPSMCCARPFVFTNLKTDEGLDAVVDWALEQIQLPRRELFEAATYTPPRKHTHTH